MGRVWQEPQGPTKRCAGHSSPVLRRREHQHNDGAGQVFTEQHCSHNRDASQQVGPKLAMKSFACQFNDQGQSAHKQRDEQRHVRIVRSNRGRVSQYEVGCDADQRDDRDPSRLASRERTKPIGLGTL